MKTLFLILFLGLVGSSGSLLFGGGDVATNDPPVVPDPTPIFDSVDGNGRAELVNVPAPAATVSAGSQIDPTFQIDSDTGFALVFLAVQNDTVPVKIMVTWLI